MSLDWEALRAAARAMIPKAYAPYSNYRVGAALRQVMAGVPDRIVETV